MVAKGTAINRYAVASGGTVLLGTLVLANNHYYASQTIVGECESTTRVNVLASVSTTVNWLGTTSSDWSVASNWCSGVPTPTSNVLIPSGNVHITTALSSPTVCHNLTISWGAVLTIDAGKALTVNGILTNNAGTTGLIIKSDVSGAGSLINNTSGVNASVELYLAQGSGIRHHYISSPITAASSNMFSGYYVYRYDEPTTAWVNMLANQTLSAMTGYSVYKPNTSAITKTFIGTLNTGLIGTEQNVTFLNTGWNLVGNPYPSAIDWNSASWTRTNVLLSFYTWDQTMKRYTSYVNGVGANGGNNIIPSMQGFMVRVDTLGESTGTLIMTNAIRVHNNQAFWKNNIHNQLRLTASIVGFEDETIVRFEDQSSNEFDSKWDALKLMADQGGAQLYTKAGNKDLSINTLPLISNDLIIPLQLKINQNGQYQISATELESFDAGTFIYLEDLRLNSMIDLMESPVYVFSGIIGDNSDRFRLHFNLTPQSINSETRGNISVYSYDNKLYVKTPKNAQGNVEVYDVLGKQLYVSQLKNTTLNTFVLNNLSTGYYIVKVNNVDKVISEKILIK